MSIQMIGEQVLVAAAPKEETTAGGIILSADVKQTASEPGIILSVGPEATHLNKGDTVYLSWDKSMPVRIGGQDAAIIAAEHIKAVLS
jgi:co-chaperonin GroES (HSP10)